MLPWTGSMTKLATATLVHSPELGYTVLEYKCIELLMQTEIWEQQQ